MNQSGGDSLAATIEIPDLLLGLIRKLQLCVSAERYLIVWSTASQVAARRMSERDMVIVSAQGFVKENVLTTEPLSLGLLRHTLKLGQTVWSGEPSAEANTNTFLLSGIHAYLSIPWKLEEGTALLYADSRGEGSEIDYTSVIKAQNLRVQPYQGRTRTPAPARPVASETPPTLPNLLTLSLAEQVRTFRVLATFLGAGLSLVAALKILSQQDESARLREMAARLQLNLLRGQSLSQALHQEARLGAFVMSLLRCAEETGQLHQILLSLSEHQEKAMLRVGRLRTALIYPGFLFCLVALMALLLPPYLLSQGVLGSGPQPWPTRLALSLRSLPGRPEFLGLMAFGLASAWAGLRYRRPQLILVAHQWAASLPGIQRLRSAWLEVQLCTTLGLQLQAGLPLLGAVQRSLEACHNPFWEETIPDVVRSLAAGDSLSASLSQLEGIRPRVLQILAAGEELGRPGDAFQWLARLSQDEFEGALEQSIIWLEPIVLIVLGVVVGFTCLAALLPGLQMLQV